MTLVSNVLYLPRGLNTTYDADIEHRPRANMTQQYPPLQTAVLLNRWSCVQGLPVPEIIHRGAPLTLRDNT